MKKAAQRAFTLIELLVTIAIIAILSTIGMVAYSDVLKQGRDSKRKADLKEIQTALEMYYIDHGTYSSYRIDACPTGGAFKFDCPYVVEAESKTYMKMVPNDPDPTKSYKYVPFDSAGGNVTTPVSTSTPAPGATPVPSWRGVFCESNICTKYCLYAKLDYLPSNYTKPAACTDGGYNYALTPP